ncbi:TPA: type III toxin-antitoxin system ToxN/AbiQ family toxin [Pasteurella multocida]|uniref:type III toxin-antitoxin system ToxN/AbiQ family toxin n=1 Tax=Pasteurella multocida TaxID=747 RepID=UPI0032FE7EB1|nr:type III toxin-antitoxin system ToxN/AbiQ family toxin [Pasteurella multocida]
MTDKLKLYRVTDHYLDFLREVEPKVPANKDNGKDRPFVGIVLFINGVKYVAPLSSQIRSSQSDFKIKSGDEQKATIRFAYMFPVVDSALIEIDYTEEFKIDLKYTALLIKEDLYINQHKARIHQIATKTYTNTITRRFGFENFCCNFTKLEERYKSYTSQ